MTVGVFFKDGTNVKFENVLSSDFLILQRDFDVHEEKAMIPRENIVYYVVNKEKEKQNNDRK